VPDCQLQSLGQIDNNAEQIAKIVSRWAIIA
jgi:hypothetical protein